MLNTKVIYCDECDPPKASTVFCINCECGYCESCDRNRHTKQLSKHKRVKLDSVCNSSTLLCQEHEEEVLEKYCVTCQKMVCGRCIIQSHKLHELKEFGEAIDSILDQSLTDIEEENEKEKKLIQESQKAINKTEEIIHTKSESIYELSKNQIQKLYNKINSHEKLLLQTIKDHYKTVNTNLDSFQEKADSFQQTLNQIKSYSLQSLMFLKNNQFEKYSHYYDLIDNFFDKEVKITSFNKPPIIGTSTNLVNYEELKNSLKAIQLDDPISIENTIFRFPEYIYTGKLFKIEIEIVDNNSMPIFLYLDHEIECSLIRINSIQKEKQQNPNKIKKMDMEIEKENRIEIEKENPKESKIEQGQDEIYTIVDEIPMNLQFTKSRTEFNSELEVNEPGNYFIKFRIDKRKFPNSKKKNMLCVRKRYDLEKCKFEYENDILPNIKGVLKIECKDSIGEASKMVSKSDLQVQIRGKVESNKDQLTSSSSRLGDISVINTSYKDANYTWHYWGEKGKYEIYITLNNQIFPICPLPLNIGIHTDTFINIYQKKKSLINISENMKIISKKKRNRLRISKKKKQENKIFCFGKTKLSNKLFFFTFKIHKRNKNSPLQFGICRWNDDPTSETKNLILFDINTGFVSGKNHFKPQISNLQNAQYISIKLDLRKDKNAIEFIAGDETTGYLDENCPLQCRLVCVLYGNGDKVELI
ncbi:tripartite motif-containing 33-like [Anaeramoeba flamelloides]|uniref:Tripartite motif-containing 33-like n=1 Tax=Anaeramoeba flamelloides TaxID=1746091 RepID=A0AAV7Z8Q4_9EUKA|nr:tripartite motif-containing 33-like [Anaeramoeba flamelloides]